MWTPRRDSVYVAARRLGLNMPARNIKQENDAAAEKPSPPAEQKPKPVPEPSGKVIRTTERAPRRIERRFWRTLLVWIGLPLLGLLGLILFIPRSGSSRVVALVKPVQVTISETVTANGQAQGEEMTLMGGPSAGPLQKLFVKAGDRVKQGQKLAIISNQAAQGQVAQAEQALNPARARLAQAENKSRRSNNQAATNQTKQAQAQTAELQTKLKQAQQALAQTQACLWQAESEREAALKASNQAQDAFQAAAVSDTVVAQTQKNLEAADRRVEAAREVVAAAEHNVQVALGNPRTSQANASASRSQQRPASGDVQTARQEAQDPMQTLRVAQ